MSTAAIYRRAVRRETHSPRSGIAITLAVVLILALAWVGVESVLAALGQPALLVAPSDGVVSVLQAATAPVAALTAGGVVAAVIGLVLMIVAVAPGRRGRRGARASQTDRTAAIVDDRVIAQSIARAAAYAGDVDPSQVRVSIGTRSARVDVSPSSGRAVSRDEVQSAVDAELAAYDYSPSLRGRVHLGTEGKVSR